MPNKMPNYVTICNKNAPGFIAKLKDLSERLKNRNIVKINKFRNKRIKQLNENHNNSWFIKLTKQKLNPWNNENLYKSYDRFQIPPYFHIAIYIKFIEEADEIVNAYDPSQVNDIIVKCEFMSDIKNAEAHLNTEGIKNHESNHSWI